MDTNTQQNPQPWFRAAGSTLFLMVLSGEIYETKIVPAARLVEAFVEAIEGSMEDVDQAVIDQITTELADEDQWSDDAFVGPCEFSTEIGEGGRLSFYRILDLSILGAIPSRPDVDDGAPDCPLMHILHPNAAGCTPTLVYGCLPPHQAKLAHP